MNYILWNSNIIVDLLAFSHYWDDEHFNEMKWWGFDSVRTCAGIVSPCLYTTTCWHTAAYIFLLITVKYYYTRCPFLCSMLQYCCHWHLQYHRHNHHKLITYLSAAAQQLAHVCSVLSTNNVCSLRDNDNNAGEGERMHTAGCSNLYTYSELPFTLQHAGREGSQCRCRFWKRGHIMHCMWV